ncbi:MAG: ATP phosphoribosyltransferase regulatory subunit [Clostridia bacterium]|nr:ATP phosphoribosyltransferase regulatory subunit [Clostridia bacterium]
MQKTALKSEERAVLELRSIYDQFGYSPYKMSKFEEYDLYVRNKDFLVSDAVITFTDTNGKLLALKPDVTLSIIKNTQLLPGQVKKLYYTENVYRVSQKTQSFKEIMQVGLECIGEIDEYCLYEVLVLAAKSLRSISKNSVLDISHMGILAAIMDKMSLSKAQSARVLACISAKNVHELEQELAEVEADEADKALLLELAGIYGKANAVLPRLEKVLSGTVAWDAFSQLKTVLAAFEGSELNKMIHIDFSVINDLKYYNGVIFKGFVEGIPASILSGGQYDKLMRKMKRSSGAVGFAVYLDMLERFDTDSKAYDVNTVILYDSKSSLQTIKETVAHYAVEGTVLTLKTADKKLHYRRLVEIRANEVKVVEENA